MSKSSIYSKTRNQIQRELALATEHLKPKNPIHTLSDSGNPPTARITSEEKEAV
ncbi:MAG: hypothetical protein NTV93_09440 [Verrucomicrobia bacterium]|nr:hypothetical protein [Verrucomicrobiota bacterium]